MEKIDKILSDAERLDLVSPGRLFAYVYETGDEELDKVAKIALEKFYNKNMLDFTVYKSAIFFERAVVEFCKNLLHGKNAFGTFTFGGTESIILAVLSARNNFWKRMGKNKIPQLVVPFTIHSSFFKAAHYLGLKVKVFDVDENLKADAESLKSIIGSETALIAISAPNWPFGTIDPVKEIAEIAQDKGILLHVDACLGGFILPFFEKLGEKVEPFDFRVEGVTSISADVHKYGYAPKGASVVLFNSDELKKDSIFVNTSNPGYIFINTGVLSSRSLGPLASAFAVINYLGEKGYIKLAKDVLIARDKIYMGMKSLGFKSVAPIESSILSLYCNEIDMISFVSTMRDMGWHFHLQRGFEKYNIPTNIHLTISPIHRKTAEEFLHDAKKALETKKEIKINEIQIEKVLEEFKSGKIDSSIAPLLVGLFEPEAVDEIVKNLVIGLYG
ncbi:MAG: aspartate aminotransferase family protein [Archaeoglobaceae archaeon]